MIEQCNFWTILAEWVTGIGTLALAFVAVFQQWLQQLVTRPRLRIEVRMARPDAEKTRFGGGVDVYYFRLRVTNDGNTAARDVQVYLARIQRRRLDKTYDPVERYMPMSLIWAHTKSSTKPVILPQMPPSFCDLGHITDPKRNSGINENLPDVSEDKAVFALDLEVLPNSKGHLLGPGLYHLTLILAASNCPPRPYVLELDFKGEWYDAEDRMFTDGLGLRLI